MALVNLKVLRNSIIKAILKLTKDMVMVRFDSK